MKKKTALSICLIIATLTLGAQTHLTLEGCRDLALQGNKQAQIDKENLAAAQDLRKAALARYFPKVSANGAYVWSQNNLYLISDEARLPFGTMNPDGSFSFNENIIQTYFPDLDKRLSDWFAQEYKKLYEDSELDFEHVFVGEVGVTQPIFTGGRITQLYKIAKAGEEIAGIQQSEHNEELIVKTDEAYWRVVSVSAKYQLADRFCHMLQKVKDDLEAAVAEGTSTQSELLQISVKLNEAEISRMKAENGLRLSKMALCQLCGLPLDTDILLDDSHLEDVVLDIPTTDTEAIISRRHEVQMLAQASKMAQAGVRLTASQLMPTIVANANYITTNPNLYNGYQNTFGGSFHAGVAVNIPVAHADDILAVKAAKHKARTIALQEENAREMLALQICQTTQQLGEANRKLAAAGSAIKHAEENLKLAEAGFEEGMITSTELLGAQTAWLKAYSEKIDAAIDVRLYEVYLLKNTGTLAYNSTTH